MYVYSEEYSKPPAATNVALDALSKDSMRVSWKLPAGFKGAGSFAVVSLQAEGSDRWLRVDSNTGKLDDPDALPLPYPKAKCVVEGVDAGVRYSAKVRLGNQAGWGCDSEASKGLKLSALRPTVPAPPVLEVVDGTSMRVHFTLPPQHPGAPPQTHVGIGVRAGENGRWLLVDAVTSKRVQLGQDPTPTIVHKASVGEALVTGLEEGATYNARVQAYNSCGWGSHSAASEGLKLSGLRPTVPAPPVLEVVDGTSMRVHFTLPPRHPGAPPQTHVAILVRAGENGRWLPVDAATSKQVQLGQDTTPTRFHMASVGEALVTGLEEGTTYNARVVVNNSCGWGSHSAMSEGITLPQSDVEVTGETTWEGRDKELRKQAVDVETAGVARKQAVSRIPASKRQKK